jgi:exosortase H (IPTLxxWG-CTERM-specific)
MPAPPVECRMVRFFVVFLVLLAVLFGLELTPWVQAWLVVPWTNTLAAISTALVTLFDQDVVASGNVIRSGCNGVEATLVLLAAILAYPAPWGYRFIGLGIGVVAVQALNVVRVISLFYLGQWSFTVFEWAHLYVWQALIMLDVLIVWLVWVRRVPAIEDDPLQPPPPPALAAG